MKEISLISPYPNGSDGDKPKKDGLEYLKKIKEIENFRKAGKPIYFRVLRGDYKGSIAKFVTDEPIKTNYYYDGYTKVIRYEINGGTHGHLIWDGRKNKIKAFLYEWGWDPDYSWLKDYDGETIYKRFDKKKAKEEALKKVKVKDIDGNILKVGDKVLYVNIRYGSGSDLCRGEIVRFEAKAWSSDGYRKEGNVVFTIIKENNSGEESKIEHSKRLILKK